MFSSQRIGNNQLIDNKRAEVHGYMELKFSKGINNCIEFLVYFFISIGVSIYNSIDKAITGKWIHKVAILMAYFGLLIAFYLCRVVFEVIVVVFILSHIEITIWMLSENRKHR